MRIGFNAQRLTGQRLGVGRYIEYVVRHWSDQLAPDEQVVLYLRSPLDAEGRRQLGGSPAIDARVLRPALTGVAWENVNLTARARELDVLYCPAYSAPVFYRGRHVVAIHSINEAQSGTHPWWYEPTYGRLYRRSARRADAVIVPSASTRDDLVRLYGIAPERVAIVPQGADDAFRPLNDPALAAATRARFFGTDRPYILFVGKCSQRRNIPMLLAAFARLKRERDIPHGLLLFGPNHLDLPLEQMCRELDIEGSVVQTEGRVSDHAELVPIYNAADVFVHPSSYEGWSMTTMEALACGTAVVAVNRGGLGEVAHGHALTIDEPTEASLAAAIGRVLEDDALRGELQEKARRRGASFRWQDTARQTLDVLRRVARA